MEELANQLEISAKGVEWQIQKMKRRGILERIGAARGGAILEFSYRRHRRGAGECHLPPLLRGEGAG